MASLSREKLKSGIGWRIVWYDSDGKQKALRLGKTSRRNAERMLILVERLLEAKRLNLPLDGETTSWLEELDDAIRDRLARLGLAPSRKTMTVAEFLSQWLAHKRQGGAAPGSLATWGQVVKEMTVLFGSKLLTALQPADGERFRENMRLRNLRPTTIAKKLDHARCMLGDAVRWGLLPTNPWRYVRHRRGDVSERRAYVPVSVIGQAIEYAPGVWWKLLLALARFGGLRIPSEAFQLTWEGVNWERGLITVPSPKTARQGKPWRVIPMFPQLRPYLEAAWDVAEEGQAYVFPEDFRRKVEGGHMCLWGNLRYGLLCILRRAGIEPWPRLWHSLRASCESDLAASFPLATVAKWLGNTPSIALRHYVDPTDQMTEAAKRWEYPLGRGATDTVKNSVKV